MGLFDSLKNMFAHHEHHHGASIGQPLTLADAKAVLEKKGVTYPNVYFNSDSEAGKFVENIYAYPTTYVIDRNGNIVGDPIVGAVTSDSQMKTLNSLIDQALAADNG